MEILTNKQNKSFGRSRFIGNGMFSHSTNYRTDKVNVKNRFDINQVEEDCDEEKAITAKTSHDLILKERIRLRRDAECQSDCASPHSRVYIKMLVNQ
jgi:hypothetical protein